MLYDLTWRDRVSVVVHRLPVVGWCWFKIKRIVGFFDYKPRVYGEFVRFDGLELTKAELDNFCEVFTYSAEAALSREWRWQRRVPVAESLRVVIKRPGPHSDPLSPYGTIGWKLTTFRHPRLFAGGHLDYWLRAMRKLDFKRPLYVASLSK